MFFMLKSPVIVNITYSNFQCFIQIDTTLDEYSNCTFQYVDDQNLSGEKANYSIIFQANKWNTKTVILKTTHCNWITVLHSMQVFQLMSIIDL